MLTKCLIILVLISFLNAIVHTQVTHEHEDTTTNSALQDCVHSLTFDGHKVAAHVTFMGETRDVKTNCPVPSCLVSAYKLCNNTSKDITWAIMYSNSNQAREAIKLTFYKGNDSQIYDYEERMFPNGSLTNCHNSQQCDQPSTNITNTISNVPCPPGFNQANCTMRTFKTPSNVRPNLCDNCSYASSEGPDKSRKYWWVYIVITVVVIGLLAGFLVFVVTQNKTRNPRSVCVTPTKSAKSETSFNN